jgi:outer membrane receptor for ferric coprogen and ferric-rhodotorulic acid
MRNYSLSLLVLACLAQSVLGQSVPTTEEVVRLNPFEVVEQQDDSFTTNSVGSGSRLKLDLKDVPAAYSVINRSFIDALGINDLQEAASWAPGQTFFYNMNGGMAIFGEQGSYVSRGFTTAPGGANVNFSSGNGSMRNFYSNSTSNTDSYMVETFDFGRGPNSSLFGTAQAPTGAVAQGAGLSGVNSTQTKRTRFDGVRASIQLEFGSYGYKRQALDYNRPLTDRIGIRMNLVNSEAPGYLRHDLETVRGIHLTGTWRITDSTSLTIEGSNDKTTTHGAGANINENFSGWDGSTVFRGPLSGRCIRRTRRPVRHRLPTPATARSSCLAAAA